MSAPQATATGPRGRAWLAWLVAVFVAALLPRLVLVQQFEREHPQAQRPVIDEASYERWALEIAAGDWVGREVFFQEPLYPYWLGAVYAVSGQELEARRTAARRLQAVLGALTAVLVALLGARVFSPNAGLVAGFALAFYRPAIWMGALLLKPNLFLPLFVLFALALLATRHAERLSVRRRLALWLALGILAGLGVLLRGNMLVLAPAFVVWPVARAALQRRAWRPELAASAAVLGGIVLVLAPVALRNRAVGGRLVLSTSGAGTNLYGGNNPGNPYGLATEFPWVRGVPDHEADDWRHEAERRLGRPLDAIEVSRYWLGEVLASARRDPGLHAVILWRKLRLTLGRYEVPDNHFIEWDARWLPLLRAPLPGFALWGTLALAGLLWTLVGAVRTRAGRDGPALELALLGGLYLATIVLTVTSERVRLALVPLLLPFAGAWLLAVLRLRGRSAALLGALALAALMVLTPVLPARKRADDFDERDHNLAVGLLKEPVELDAAVELSRGLEQRHGAAPRVLVLAAEVDYRLARRLLDAPGHSRADARRAEELVRAALARLERAALSERSRERFQADALAGVILQYLGRWDESATRYRAALGFDPSDRDLRRRLAVAVAEQAMLEGDLDRRRAGLEEALRMVEGLLEEADDGELERLARDLRAALPS